MDQILNHTQPYNYHWGKAINDYQFQKTNLEWGVNPKPRLVTDRMVKDNDKIFNPILQTYNDKSRERSLRQHEQKTLIDTIVRNQDYQLKMEQTFNIINLKDRLKGFESDPNYPIAKEAINKRKNLNTNRTDYNILSNLPLSQHHYDKPENRPRTENSVPTNDRQRTIKASNYRDYDIISTRYKQFHDDKTKVDKEINKIQTAKLFFKRNDYNPIKGAYFDENKEQEYQRKKKEEIENWGKEYKKNLPACAKGQSDLYNLINMKTVNQDELTKVDQHELNKKKRYGLRYEIENYYHNKSLKHQDKEDYIRDRKYSYMRYKDIDERQFDIIDLKDKPYKEHSKNVKKDNLTDWEKLIANAGDNNTFATKTIYKDIYDYTENGKNYDKFMDTRNKTLSQLNELNKDDAFGKTIPVNRKVNNKKEEENKNVKINVRERMIQFDKQRFFKQPPKNVNYNNSNEQ